MANFFNSMFFFSLLVAISTLMAVPSGVEAQSVLPTVLNVTNINGTVPCALNVTVSSNGSLSGNPPPFPFAVVQVRCNTTTATATAIANANGFFVIVLNSLTNPTLTVPTLLNNCKLVVTTPLSRCNVTLSSALNGSTFASDLQSALPPTTSLLRDLIIINYLIPSIFRPSP